MGATLHRGVRASHYRGLSWCGAQAPDAQAQQLWLTGLVTPRHVGSSQTRARTRVPCIGRQILNHCATREAPHHGNLNSPLERIVKEVNGRIYLIFTRRRGYLSHTNIDFFFLFFYFWLCWVFVSVRGLSLVTASGGQSSSRCAGLLLSWPLLLRSTGSRRAGSVVVAHGPSRSAACGILPDQGSNPCPLHWQAESQPLRHQGSPKDRLLCWYISYCDYPT